MNKNTFIGAIYIIVMTALIIMDAILLVNARLSRTWQVMVTIFLVMNTWHLSSVLTTAKIIERIQLEEDEDDDEIK